MLLLKVLQTKLLMMVKKEVCFGLPKVFFCTAKNFKGSNIAYFLHLPRPEARD
jgi:hypothetical protein